MESEAIKALVLRLSDADMKGKHLAGKSREAALKSQREFIAWTARRSYPLEDMTAENIREYHTELCGRRSKRTGELLNPHTVNSLFHGVMVLFSLLYRENVISVNPAQNLDLKIPAGGGVKRRPLTRQEITAFLEHLDTGTAQGLKDRTLFELVYSSGLRIAEVSTLKVRDIDFERREMVVRGKGNRDRLVPFSAVAQQFLLLFLGDRIHTPEQWVFCGSRGSRTSEHIRSGGISERFKTLLRRFDMDKKEISTHSIRHSTATHLLENGANIRHVQELLGHKSIETTVRYTHLQTDGLMKVYLKYHPGEHELYRSVDDIYMRRLDMLLADNKRK